MMQFLKNAEENDWNDWIKENDRPVNFGKVKIDKKMLSEVFFMLFFMLESISMLSMLLRKLLHTFELNSVISKFILKRKIKNR